MSEELEVRGAVRTVVAELARAHGVVDLDGGDAVARVADLLGVIVDSWITTSTRASAVHAYHAGRADEADAKPCPYCPPAAPPVCRAAMRR